MSLIWRPWVCRECVDRAGDVVLRPLVGLKVPGVFFKRRRDAVDHAVFEGHHVGRLVYRLVPGSGGSFGAVLALSAGDATFLCGVGRRNTRTALRKLAKKRLVRRVGLLGRRYVASAEGMLEFWGAET